MPERRDFCARGLVCDTLPLGNGMWAAGYTRTGMVRCPLNKHYPLAYGPK